MGIEQRIDMLSPLQGALKGMADAFKQNMPDKVKVEVEVTPSVTQETEDALARLQKPETATSKLAEKGADPFAKPSMSNQEEIDKVLQRITAIAGRIGYLMDKVAQGKDATGNAAQEIERLRDSLEKLGQKGREAAKNLGDDGLAGKISEAETAAGQGKGGPSGLSAGGVSPEMLMGMVRNPQGGVMQGAGMILKQLLSEGGMLSSGGFLAGAGGAALGVAGAVAGGIYAGWKINSKLADDATFDAGNISRDARISRSVSRDFDFRSSLFTPNGFGPKYNTQDEQVFSNDEVRSVLGSMGVGVDNWTTRMGQGKANFDDVAKSAMMQSVVAYQMGASTDQVAGMVGASVRTGALSPDDMKVHQYLNQIAGATAEAAKYGITTAEKLTTIAALNQRSVAETGMLTGASSALNMKALGAMEATGDAALKGQLGASTLGVLAGSGSDEARAREIGFMLDSQGNLLPEFQAMVNENPHLRAMQRELGSKMVANALLDDPSVRAAVNQRGIKSIAGAGGSAMLGFRMMGGSAYGSKGAAATYGAALSGDFLSWNLPTKDQTILGGDSQSEKERRDALLAVFAKQQSEEVRKTGYDMDTAKNLNEAASNLNAAANHLGKSLTTDNLGGTGMSLSDGLGMNPVTAPTFWMWKALH